MNGSFRTLFLLVQRMPLPAEAMSDDMAEVLGSPLACNFAPLVLSAICEWMELHQTHTFTIRANQLQSYEVDLTCSFLSVLKHLPTLKDWLEAKPTNAFHLDINNQGCDLRVELTRVENTIRHACIENQWHEGRRNEGDWEDTAESLSMTCEEVVRGVVAVAMALPIDVGRLPSFQDWCAKCGYQGKLQ